jgi:hypothetical protein
MRQSSQLPARGSKRFYTIDPDNFNSKGQKGNLNNMISAQDMARGRKSVNRSGYQDSQHTTDSQKNLDNVRVSIGNPFMSAEMSKYI